MVTMLLPTCPCLLISIPGTKQLYRILLDRWKERKEGTRERGKKGREGRKKEGKQRKKEWKERKKRIYDLYINLGVSLKALFIRHNQSRTIAIAHVYKLAFQTWGTSSTSVCYYLVNWFHWVHLPNISHFCHLLVFLIAHCPTLGLHHLMLGRCKGFLIGLSTSKSISLLSICS